MAQRVGEVTVMRIPNVLSVRQRSLFFREFEDHIEVMRPSIVLDCSNVRQMDGPMLELLLYCLEETMKRNGDIRIAAISCQARTILDGNGIAALFQFYDTPAQAVASFRSVSVAAGPQFLPQEFPQEDPANAA